MAKSSKQVKKPPEGKSLISINVPLDVIAKMQYIAGQEGVTYSETYNKAFEKLIELWENKNGKIKPRPKGKGLESL